MFTGLIKDLGIIKSMKKIAEGVEFEIQTKLVSEIGIDDSVAVNGVCLTATSVSAETFKMQAVNITLEKTTLGKLNEGDLVNLELALRFSDRLGGHIVQGHVNGVGALENSKNQGENYELWFSIPNQFKKYIVKEGSIAIDGISLTVADVDFDHGSRFMVTIIPHTWNNTQLHKKRLGDGVNIEVDMMAKYLENFIKYADRN